MAIYSLNLRSVGKTTHKAGTAGAHIRYIGRPGEDPIILSENMPSDPQEARTWMDNQEKADRKNARVIDKLRIALPRELTTVERVQAIKTLMDDLTQNGRVAWYAAFHDQGSDAHNPHVHIVVRDRDIKTRNRVLCLSDSIRDREKKGLPGPSAAEWVRQRWENHCNAALKKAGHVARIDRRTLEGQGIERMPTIHEGPNGRHVETFVQRPDSQERHTANNNQVGPNGSRVIDYPFIDAGRTRRERNIEIMDFNLEQAARSPNFETRVMAQHEREQAAQDRVLSRRIVASNRRRTLQVRRIRQAAKAKADGALHERRQESAAAKVYSRGQFIPARNALRLKHEAEKLALKQRQRRILGRVWSALDLTGKIKEARGKERSDLKAAQALERQDLASGYRKTKAALQDAVLAKYAPIFDDINRDKKARLSGLADRHGDEISVEERLLQSREVEREKARATVEKQIQTWKRTSKKSGSDTTARARQMAQEIRAQRPKTPGKNQEPEI